MSISLNLYPTLNRDLYDKIGYFANSYNFFYNYNGNKYELNAESGLTQNQNILQITDNNCEWHASNYDLCFQRNYVIKNPMFLFGSQGIAHQKSQLGLALVWSSKASNQRGALEIKDFDINNKTVTAEFAVRFEKGQLKGKILFQTALFLKHSEKKDSLFASSSGTILGVLDEYTITIDGSGSVFPIIEIEKPSLPLWYVKCDWLDPTTDPFDEDYVCLYLNKSSPYYSLLNIDEGLKDSPFLKEIIASAMQTIVQKVVNGPFWDDIISKQDFEEGSIGQAIYYFVTTFGWDTDSPERLALTIRKDFESRLGG